MSGGEAAGSTTRLVQLDGLRGIAILVVMAHHFGLHVPRWMDCGPIAPSIFFLLSGYLITLSLLKIHRSKEAGVQPLEPLLLFHFRRLSRLAPALYILLLVGWLADWREYREGFFWHATFLSNFRMVITEEWGESLSHFWSLAMQEQFYLLWPLIVFLPRRLMPWALGAAIVTGICFRLWCLHSGASEFFRWFLLPGSFDDFATGGLVALAIRARGGRPVIPHRWKLPTAGIACASWWFARQLRGLYVTDPSHPGIAFIDVFQDMFFAWLLITIVENGRGWIAQLISVSPLVVLGKISYGIYLWHMLLLFALGPYLDQWGVTVKEQSALRFFTLGLISVGVGFVSWSLLEKPFITWGSKLATPDGAMADWIAKLLRFFTLKRQA